jgi:chromosome segregation ATPase
MLIWQKKEIMDIFQSEKDKKYRIVWLTERNIGYPIAYTYQQIVDFLTKLFKKIQQLTTANKKLKDENTYYTNLGPRMYVASSQQIAQLEADKAQIEKENKKLLQMAHQRVDKYQEEINRLQAEIKKQPNVYLKLEEQKEYLTTKKLDVEIKLFKQIEELKQENQRLQGLIQRERNNALQQKRKRIQIDEENDLLCKANADLQAQIAQLQENQCNPRKECMLLLPEAK